MENRFKVERYFDETGFRRWDEDSVKRFPTYNEALRYIHRAGCQCGQHYYRVVGPTHRFVEPEPVVGEWKRVDDPEDNNAAE